MVDASSSLNHDIHFKLQFLRWNGAKTIKYSHPHNVRKDEGQQLDEVHMVFFFVIFQGDFFSVLIKKKTFGARIQLS